ncbi:alpha-tocopherol transfer protein-like [Phlebotomus argentipes]|uniref:alpha-tocopherol transfer protein-like n=1 Tax=Phlebotomus argentipes TaxID=94469 RepID=UPI0028936DF9|nr:alpha-tocopherol transfer protein-like [Phlebotomus argentipes]
MPAVEVAHILDLNPELPEKIKEVAYRQGEDSDKVCTYLQEFRDLIYEKGTCTPHRTDDEYLLRFLRARFFRVDNAYKLLCRYYAFREQHTELYSSVRPMTLRPIGEDDIVSVTPYRDQNGRRLMFYKVGNWKPSKIPLDDLFRATLIILEIGAMEPQTQVVGGVGVFDLEGLTLNHCWHMSPSVAQKMIALMVTCMPVRTTSIHIVNQSWAFDAVFQVFKPFLNENMKEKIFIHGNDMSSLHKHILPAHLPERYGGKMAEYNYNTWLDSLKVNDKVLKELVQLGYNIPTEDLA